MVALLDAATRHAALRATFGLNADLVDEVAVLGTSAWLDQQLDPGSITDTTVHAVLTQIPLLNNSITQTRAQVEAGQIKQWDAMHALCVATLARATWSKRQLFEVMVDLWSNHFNVTCPSSEVWDNRHRYDADVIRANALGKYTDLLHAVTTHPAMLKFLNNSSSRKDNPNENQGREILELHSVGVGHYTEADVKTSTMILTGLSTDWTTGEFLYRPSWHYTGPVQVMDFTHANTNTDGQAVVAAYTAYLARHPATAQRIARTLALRFVSDNPPTALVNRLAGTYLANDTAIVPVLRELFATPEFAAAAGVKVRTPYENLIATVRVLGLGPPATGIDPIQGLYWAAENMGQAPLGWPQPDGYPADAASWQSASGTLARWNMNSSLVGDWWPQGLTRPTLTSYLPSPLPATHGALLTLMARNVRLQEITAAELNAIAGWLGVSVDTPLAADSPAVTWRLEHVIALLLDSPTQARR